MSLFATIVASSSTSGAAWMPLSNWRCMLLGELRNVFKLAAQRWLRLCLVACAQLPKSSLLRECAATWCLFASSFHLFLLNFIFWCICRHSNSIPWAASTARYMFFRCVKLWVRNIVQRARVFWDFPCRRLSKGLQRLQLTYIILERLVRGVNAQFNAMGQILSRKVVLLTVSVRLVMDHAIQFSRLYSLKWLISLGRLANSRAFGMLLGRWFGKTILSSLWSLKWFLWSCN